MRIKKSYSITIAEIPALAKQVAGLLRGSEILALVGQLGSGKTTFAKALAKHLKIKGIITSPTFVLMNAFRGRLPKNRKPIFLLHLDLYRAKNFKEVKALGLNELWEQKDAVTVIEWADKIKKHLPPNAITIQFSHDK